MHRLVPLLLWVLGTLPAAAQLPTASIRAARREPATTHRIAPVLGETLQVTVAGAGDPVVIVPGTWSNAYAFRKVVAPLVASGARVILIEPLGVASSAKPRRADYSMAAQGRRIGAILDSLGVPRALFVGQAASTTMLLHLALANPSRMSGLLSIEGGAAERQATEGMQRALAAASLLVRIFPSQGLLRWKLRGHLEGVSGDRTWITREVMDAYMAPMKHELRETVAAYREMASASEPAPLAPRLRELTVPVLVLLGDAPHFGGPDADELDRMVAGITTLTIRRIPAAGHLIHEEQPGAVLDAISHLRRSFASSRRTP